jgi:hypothetical protein
MTRSDRLYMVIEYFNAGAARIDLQPPVVVTEILLGQGEVEEDLPPLRSAHRLEMIRETVLVEQGVARLDERRPRHRDGVELATLGEDVVDIVHDDSHDDTILGGNRCRLRCSRAPPAPGRASDCNGSASHSSTL